MSQNPASRVIKKCGGHRVVAEWLSVDVSQVFRWTYPKERGGTDGRIPSRHQEALLEAARAKEIRLRPADFFRAPARNGAEKRATAE